MSRVFFIKANGKTNFRHSNDHVSLLFSLLSPDCVPVNFHHLFNFRAKPKRTGWKATDRERQRTTITVCVEQSPHVSTRRKALRKELAISAAGETTGTLLPRFRIFLSLKPICVPRLYAERARQRHVQEIIREISSYS